MFESLTNKFEEIFSTLKKAPSLNEKQVDEGLREIRQALLGADVALAANDMPTTNDYALSKITGYDCKVSRVLEEGLEAVCQSIEIHAPDGTINKNKEKK